MLFLLFAWCCNLHCTCIVITLMNLAQLQVISVLLITIVILFSVIMFTLSEWSTRLINVRFMYNDTIVIIKIIFFRFHMSWFLYFFAFRWWFFVQETSCWNQQFVIQMNSFATVNLIWVQQCSTRRNKVSILCSTNLHSKKADSWTRRHEWQYHC